MKKKIILSLASILVLMVAGYTGFWFFKANQIKKQIILFSQKEGSKFSVGEVSVEGFPLAQRVIIKNFRLTESEGSYITIKNIQVESEALSNTYFVKNLDPIEVENLEHNISSKIELSPDTIISLVTDENEVSQIKITGSGYKILDKEQDKVVLIWEAQNSEIELSIGDNFRYKYKDSGSKILDEKNNPVFTAASSMFDITYSVDDNDVISFKSNISLKDFEYSSLLYSALIKADVASPEDNPGSASTEVAFSGKSNFAISSDFILTPNKQDIVDLLPAEQMAQIPDDLKSQYQKKPSPYSYKLDLQNLEFSNSLYKILVNGLLNSTPENIEPVGFVVLKVENIDNLAKSIVDGFKNFSSKYYSVEHLVNEDSEVFNKSLSIIKELATKNPLSHDNSLVFEFKNEKVGMGAGLKINDTAFLEIVTNFLEQNKAQDSSNKGSKIPKAHLNKKKIN